jgi:hypothetical protein
MSRPAAIELQPIAWHDPGMLSLSIEIARTQECGLQLIRVGAIPAMILGAWIRDRHPDLTARYDGDSDRLLIEMAVAA